MKWLIALSIAAAAWLYLKPAQASAGPGWAEENAPDQLPTTVETLQLSMDPTTYESATLPGDLQGANERAFLDMLAVSEGTSGRGDNGYNVLFGGGLVSDYSDHPRQLITRTFSSGLTVTSSAAGRYQFLSKTWSYLASRLALSDFSPASQDAAAIELIRERGALADVHAGRFVAAVDKLATTWASLPGSPYGQPTHSLDTLAADFTAAGGTIA